MRIVKSSISVLLFAVILPIASFAQTKTVEVRISKAARMAVLQNKSKLSRAEQKLSGAMHELVEQYTRNGNTLQPAKYPTPQSVGDLQPSLAQVDTRNRIHAYLHVRGVERVSSIVVLLKRAGISVESSNETMRMIQVWATPEQIRFATRIGSVGYIDPVIAPVHSTGPVNSESVARMRADVTSRLMGADGHGIKVGVMSDDCGSLENLIAPRVTNGELAGGANTPVVLDDSWSGSRSHEGLAMMEIVQDVVPQSKLYYATAFTGLANFANNVQALAAAGCRVITDDIIYFAEPVFEDGPLSQAIDNVCNTNNVVYTSASTNFGDHNTYYFTYSPTTPQSIGGLGQGETFQDAEDFSGDGNFDNTITIANGQTVIVSLHWDDQYGASSNDYDVWLLDSVDNQVLAASAGSQTGSEDPFEIFSFQNTQGSIMKCHIVVTKYGTSESDPNSTPRMRLWCFRNKTMEYTNKQVSTLGHPTASTVLGTGAISAVASNYNTLEAFSSQGPTYIVDFGTAGSRSLSETRTKPDISCFDGVQTSVPGFNPFYGTSAAAPHAAGVAAQLLSLYPSLTAAQARDALKVGCIDYGVGGADNAFGAGRLDAFRTLALARAANSPQQFASSFTTPELGITDNSASGITSTMGMETDCPAITSDSVYVSVTIDGHPKAGDLKFTLRSPDNTTVTLMDRPVATAGNGTGQNPNLVLGDIGYDGSVQNANPAGTDEFGFYVPVNLLSSNSGFHGHTLSGDWVLTVSDNAAGNAGVLKDWGIYALEGTPLPPSLTINWSPLFIFPGDHTLRDITVNNSLSGGCSPSVVLQSIVSNELDATADLGDVANDIQGNANGTNDLAFQLRAEDLSSGKGRFYTVTYRITDAGGYMRDTSFVIPSFITPGRVNPTTQLAAGTGTVTMDVAPSPNPLSTQSTITYTISGGPGAPVVLSIVDNRGKWVRNLDIGNRAPGTYVIPFDGNASDGSQLPNGAYAYQLTVGAPYNSINTGVIWIQNP